MLPGFWGVVLSAPARKRAGSGWGKIYGNETSVPPTSLHVDNNGGAVVNFDPKQVAPHAPIHPVFRPINSMLITVTLMPAAVNVI